MVAPEMFARDMAACRALLKGGSRSFFAASWLLPAHMRDSATALYAFCRLADDAVDEGDGDPGIIAALAARVDRIYAGDPLPHPADRVFAAVVQRFVLPREVVDALIEGFEWDASGRRYHSLADVQAYAARVAGCVGIMMTTVMERRSADVLARAADLGVAMQLTNIARDVGEDARNGRLYLPEDWLRDAGIDPVAFLADPAFTPALGRIVQRLLAEADMLYRRADVGISLLPPGCQAGIRAARLIYAEIGQEIARRGHDSVSSRAVVPFGDKLPLLARALLPAALFRKATDFALLANPPLQATAFLVDAVMMMRANPWEATRSVATPSSAPWWSLSGRFLPVLSIIEKLERADRASTRATARIG